VLLAAQPDSSRPNYECCCAECKTGFFSSSAARPISRAWKRRHTCFAQTRATSHPAISQCGPLHKAKRIRAHSCCRRRRKAELLPPQILAVRDRHTNKISAPALRRCPAKTETAHFCEYASRAISSGRCGTPPGCGGAGRSSRSLISRVTRFRWTGPRRRIRAEFRICPMRSRGSVLAGSEQSRFLAGQRRSAGADILFVCLSRTARICGGKSSAFLRRLQHECARIRFAL